MLNIQIKAVGIELTNALKEYVEKKLSGVEKFSKESGADTFCYVEIGKESEHHKQGEVFKAEVNYNSASENYFVVSRQADLYVAIDDMKDELVRTMQGAKTKQETLWRRGARSVKKMLKGLSKRNPFTSKY